MLNIYALFQNVNRTIRARAGRNPATKNPQVDITQQATTPTPTTTPKRAKNPKRVAAGKMVAERTRLAREQQKKAAAEAAIIIANNKAKAAASNTVAVSEPDTDAAPAYRRRNTKEYRRKK